MSEAQPIQLDHLLDVIASEGHQPVLASDFVEGLQDHFLGLCLTVQLKEL